MGWRSRIARCALALGAVAALAVTAPPLRLVWEVARRVGSRPGRRVEDLAVGWICWLGKSVGPEWMSERMPEAVDRRAEGKKIACELVDYELRARWWPHLFAPPSWSQTTTLERGDRVQLGFENKELLWVWVVDVWEGSYVGQLASSPLVLDARLGDVVEFGPEHVFDIRRKILMSSLYGKFGSEKG